MSYTSSDWRQAAAAFLRKNTSACEEVIQHFISLYWLQDADQEDNLERFELYQTELTGAFAS